MLGYSALGIAFLFTAISVFFYGYSFWLERRGKRLSAKETQEVRGLAERGRIAYGLSALAVVTAAVFLMAMILRNNFEYAYVAGYSSLDLPFAYKFAAFWAGQEGSFLLWVLFQAVFGIFMLRQKAGAGAMAVYGVIQAGLLSLLTYKSPFMMLADARADGLGLNPLLQDPWMVIHPPVLFLGYAGLAVPFAYMMENILRKNRGDDWNLRRILNWTLFSFAALGAGMFIGGYWAYKVLGWGGYWAWDPVENSSLVPWLAAGAFIHLLILCRVNTAAFKVTSVAALFSLVLVLYGTYLTRSGVLSDFSTHSFANEGIGGYLGMFTILVAIVSFCVLIFKWQSLPDGELYPSLKSREFLLAFAALVFAVLGVLVFVGMSMPLVTMSLGNPQSVSASFYNSTSLPVALAMSALLALAPLVGWHGKKHRLEKFWLIGLVLAGSLLAIAAGIWNPIYILIIAFSFVALATNLKAFKTHAISKGAALSHVGAAVLIIGIIISSAASKTESVTFALNQPVDVFGKQITYLGTEEAPNGSGFYQNFVIKDPASGAEKILKPLTKLNKNNAPAAREPGIYRSATTDIYIAPVHEHAENDFGEELQISGSADVSKDGLTFKLGEINLAGSNTMGMVIEPTVTITDTASGQAQTVTLKLTRKQGSITSSTEEVYGRKITLVGVNTKEQKIILGIKDTQVPPVETLKADLMTKPFINLVWLGTILITAGGLISLKRYGV